MENKFYKHIKETFENPPEYPYQEAQWDKMRERLNPTVPPTPKVAFWKRYGWIALWILPFLLLGSYTIFQQHASNERIETLQKALDKEINKNQIHLSDTIFNHVVINQYDTIYHTTSVYSNTIAANNNYVPSAIGKTASASTISQQLLEDFDNIAQKFSQSEELAITKINSIGQIQQLLQKPEQLAQSPLKYNADALKEALVGIEGLAIDSLAIPLREVNFFQYFEPPTPLYQEDVELLAFMRPTGFNIGIEGSLLKLIRNEGVNQKGFTAGLTTEIEFGSNFSLLVGGEYLKLHYELEEDADISAYPVVEPENGQDAFHYLRVNSNYLQIPFGFKYRFGREKAFRPYVGVGAIARKPIRKELNYEFLSAFSEYYINRSYTNNTFSINTLRGKLGFEYRLHKNWNFYLDGTYDHDFRLSPTDFEKAKYFNLRTGVLYHF